MEKLTVFFSYHNTYTQGRALEIVIILDSVEKDFSSKAKPDSTDISHKLFVYYQFRLWYKINREESPHNIIKGWNLANWKYMYHIQNLKV